jgi:Thrombospondin type 3 repeat
VTIAGGQWRLAGLTVVAASMIAGPAAAGDWKDDFTLGLDIGLGSVITRFNATALDSGGLLLTGFRAGYDVADAWTVQLVVQQWWLPGSNHDTMPGAGLRWSPLRTSLVDLYAQGSLGAAWTNRGVSLGWDAGLGLEFSISEIPGFSLGPFARYTEAINPDPLSDANGRAWAAGVAATLRLGPAVAAAHVRAQQQAVPRPPPMHLHVPDSDRDGFTDDRDQCPTVPAGAHPDALRPGCPESDEDDDGVPDSDDVCPVIPAGDKPDPKRPGCPFSDRDGDGIVDADDACPDQPGEPSETSAKNGCPKEKPPAAKPPENAAPAETPEGLRPVHKKHARPH